jgi:hypothetical protein
MEATLIYSEVVACTAELLRCARLNWIQVEKVVYAGGRTCVAGLDDALAVHLREDAVMRFTNAIVTRLGIEDPTTVLTLCGASRRLLTGMEKGIDERIHQTFGREGEAHRCQD